MDKYTAIATAYVVPGLFTGTSGAYEIVITIFGTIASLLIAVSYLPQLIQTYKTKGTTGISFWMWLLICFAEVGFSIWGILYIAQGNEAGLSVAYATTGSGPYNMPNWWGIAQLGGSSAISAVGGSHAAIKAAYDSQGTYGLGYLYIAQAQGTGLTLADAQAAACTAALKSAEQAAFGSFAGINAADLFYVGVAVNGSAVAGTVQGTAVALAHNVAMNAGLVDGLALFVCDVFCGATAFGIFFYKVKNMMMAKKEGISEAELSDRLYKEAQEKKLGKKAA